ncbi:MAG: protein jag [Defluviitaleaceae bacterium]|nr:protein jag [Defluviitaleaceae bacterium]
MDYTEKTAKTVEEARSDALIALGLTEEDCIITVLDEGAKGGLFGIGARPARVRAEKRKDPEELVKDFIKEITLAMGFSVTVETNTKGKFLYADMAGENMGILIGKRGATLDALQYITKLAMNKHDIREKSIVVDTESYRKRRKDTLESLARGIARKVKDTRRSVNLEPMTRFERHVIHTTLQNDRMVETLSEGNEPHRYVVVSVKK